jgi:TolA-binding protein
LGESLYNQKDYARATTTFEYLVAEYPGNEKVSAALYKLGLATAETGDLVKSRKYLKRVIEEFPASDEAKLAKNKLADIR